MMKKILLVILSVVSLVLLSACGGGLEDEPSTKESSPYPSGPYYDMSVTVHIYDDETAVPLPATSVWIGDSPICANDWFGNGKTDIDGTYVETYRRYGYRTDRKIYIGATVSGYETKCVSGVFSMDGGVSYIYLVRL